ncbi:hypothetical protein TARUN_5070 [Trichoderma arundinaceum]|uniref:ABM domain-containing protein n=1 Tax=Trichoderma arundinaceum TaxID=490622 RepID=A0A395NM49_TRIAR|nr:hypothetical protein TARUN_5070 [Trichoderma arundinaceum]
MPVTEFALIKLRGNYDALEFLETLMECQEIQDNWVRQNQPCNLSPGMNLSSMYTDATDQPTLLITAPWDSPEAHGEWIQSPENRKANGSLSEFSAPGCDSVLLFHMDPAGARPQMREAFQHKDSNDIFDICRITVKDDQREVLQKEYQALENELREEGLEKSIWAGWRIEKAEGEEDLIVFWTSDVPRKRLERLASLAIKKDHRRFRHIV